MIKSKINIKRIFCALVAAAILTLPLCSLSSCGKAVGNGDGKITVMCTVFPQYDWVKNIVGESDAAEVSLLVKNGADVHSYQPSVEDMIKIKQSDLVIYVGGESDAWIDEALDGASGRAIELSQIEGITLREVSEEKIFSEEHSHIDGEHTNHEAFDEHIWLSLKNAVAACNAICDRLCEIDSENAEFYRANTNAYTERLSELDTEFSSAVNTYDKTILFADRFPFVYLFEDYAVSYAAAFKGCSTDAEASFETITRLANTLSEKNLKYVAVTESSDKKLAKSIISAANMSCEIVEFDSMQSTTEAQISDGYSYMDTMKKNLEALKKVTE